MTIARRAMSVFDRIAFSKMSPALGLSTRLVSRLSRTRTRGRGLFDGELGNVAHVSGRLSSCSRMTFQTLPVS